MEVVVPSPAEIWGGGVNVGDEICKIFAEEKKNEYSKEFLEFCDECDYEPCDEALKYWTMIVAKKEHLKQKKEEQDKKKRAQQRPTPPETAMLAQEPVEPAALGAEL